MRKSNPKVQPIHIGLNAKPGVQVRLCDWPGCDDEGEHRAPKSRDRLKEYYWFCMDHAREYNASWNYYSGMTEDEVEADRRRDTVWDRPTWRMGGMKIRGQPTVDDLDDPMGLFDDEREEAAKHRASAKHRGLSPEEEAMAVLDLRPPLEPTSVKARYKELVKRHHPDLNGGDKQAEERFKKINEAYRTVMDSLAP